MFDRRAFVVIGAAALVLGIACGGNGKEKSAAATGTAPPAGTTPGAASQATPTTPGAATQQAASGDEIAKLYENLLKVRSFRATMKIEQTGPAGAIEGTMEVVMPDRMRLKTGGAGAGALGTFELITIGNDTYLNIAGSWTRQSIPSAGINLKDLTKGIEDVSRNTSVTKGGTDTVNGKRCQLYTERTASGATNEFCIADGLPQRVVIQSASSKVTIVFTDFNANIAINPPI